MLPLGLLRLVHVLHAVAPAAAVASGIVWCAVVAIPFRINAVVVRYWPVLMRLRLVCVVALALVKYLTNAPFSN